MKRKYTNWTLTPAVNRTVGRLSGRNFLLAFITILTIGSVSAVAIPTRAATTEESTADLNLAISDVLTLSLQSPCAPATAPDEAIEINLSAPQTSGSMSSCPNIITIDTNAPGFQLLFRVGNTNLTNTAAASHVIPASSNTPANQLAANSWGFAIPSSDPDSDPANTVNTDHSILGIPDSLLGNFDGSYLTRADSNPIPTDKYTAAPTTDLPIKLLSNTTPNAELVNNQTTVFYAAAVDLSTAAGAYTNTITYTAIGENVPEPPAVTIVPNIATVIPPSGNGTNPGPQFSLIATDGSISFKDLEPNDVTIGNLPCQELATSSNGRSATCTGPTAGLSSGEKIVKVDGRVTTARVNYRKTDYPTMQSLTAGANCSTTPTIYRDTRDSQLYYVAKLADDKCWMLDNLKYRPNGDTSGTQSTSGFVAEQLNSTVFANNNLTIDGTENVSVPNLDSPKYVDPAGTSVGSPGKPNYCRGEIDMNPENITKCGFLYNWYTATAGSSPQTSFGHNPHSPGGVAPESICPSNWRLPSGYYTTPDINRDYPFLNARMNNPDATQGISAHGPNPAFLNNWLPSGPFHGVFSGLWLSGFGGQGSASFVWSSTVFSINQARSLYFTADYLYPGNYNIPRHYGFATRCISMR